MHLSVPLVTVLLLTKSQEISAKLLKGETNKMGEMGKYCKAYPVQRFREYPEWKEHLQNTRKEKRQVDGKEVEANREVAENDYFYLQENYVVTDGIFIDENIIFDEISPDWVGFCKTNLKFEVPVFEPLQERESAGTASADSTQ